MAEPELPYANTVNVVVADYLAALPVLPERDSYAVNKGLKFQKVCYYKGF